MGAKVVAIRRHGKYGASFTAVGEFENGYEAVKGVTAYTESLRREHRYIPWAKDFELVVTGRTSNVVRPTDLQFGFITDEAVETAAKRSIRGDTV